MQDIQRLSYDGITVGYRFIQDDGSFADVSTADLGNRHYKTSYSVEVQYCNDRVLRTQDEYKQLLVSSDIEVTNSIIDEVNTARKWFESLGVADHIVDCKVVYDYAKKMVCIPFTSPLSYSNLVHNIEQQVARSMGFYSVSITHISGGAYINRFKAQNIDTSKCRGCLYQAYVVVK